MAMAPQNSLDSGSIKRNDYKYYDSGVLVDHLVDFDLWQTSVVTCRLHSVNSNLFLMQLYQFPLFFGVFTYSSVCTDCSNYIIINNNLMLPP